MAWYAELNRRNWYCINGVDMIQIYKQKLYDDWYNSLTDEQKRRLEEYRKAEAEKRKHDTQMALAQLMSIFSLYPSKYW